MLGARIFDTFRGYLAETIVYLYLISIMPLRQNPLKPLVDALRDPSPHLKQLEDFLRDASVTVNMPTVESVLESSPSLRKVAEALTRLIRDYEQRQQDADLEAEIAWRELIETMEHHVH